jgi:hypothetical protein
MTYSLYIYIYIVTQCQHGNWFLCAVYYKNILNIFPHSWLAMNRCGHEQTALNEQTAMLVPFQPKRISLISFEFGTNMAVVPLSSNSISRDWLQVKNWYIEDITRGREDMTFIFEWWKQYFMNERIKPRRVMFCLLYIPKQKIVKFYAQKQIVTWSISSPVKIWKISHCVFFSISLSTI